MMANDEFNTMVEKSRRFLISADRNLEERFTDIGTFSANQSLELYLKVKLLRESGDYPHTNEIKNLLRHLLDLSNENVRKKIELILNEKSLVLSLIQDAYLTSRYFSTSYSSDDLKEMISVIKYIKEIIYNVSSQSKIKERSV